ncbi:MAG: alpha/beta hydrolase [Rhodobacteraceae bacterium]|nr:alpha/beta hydrolase [Paracoccaceae bacterium]
MSVLGSILLLVVALALGVTVITQLVGSSAAAASPRRGKMTTLSGGKIHWFDDGAGLPIVMIHGLGGNLNNFTYALTKELSGEFRTIAIDRPGCGWSERDGPAQASLPEQARMIAEFIKAEGLGQPLVVGHSLGGAIAEVLALNHPDQVGALALLCPATNRVEVLPKAFKGIDIPKPALIPVIGHSLAGAMSVLTEKQVFAEVFKPEPIAPEFLERGGGMLGRRPASFIAAAQDLAYSRASVDDILGREAELTLPIGVLYGAVDNILDPDHHGKSFADKTGATYEELPDRGHMIPLTAPKDCADFIRKIAARLSG